MMFFVSFFLAALLSVVNGQNVWKGTCRMQNGTVNGLINITQYDNGLDFSGSIQGLTPGKHGFHVHQFGDLSNGCNNAGEHYNPYNQRHGDNTDSILFRHLGDLANINAGWNGVAGVKKFGYYLSLYGQFPVLGRSLVVHAMRDDLGVGPEPESLKNGDSGKRVGCCVIGVANTS